MLWGEISLEMQEPAFALTESLKLILSENLAARLKGDYKMGKKINIKKIISYVASNYQRDKIWIKRKKKSKREYQIVIAIDNSKSMAPTRLLTLKTLSLVTTAFANLGIGHVAVIKFGNTVEIFKEFLKSEMSNQELGNMFLNQLMFNETQTNIEAAIKEISSYLNECKHQMRQAADDDGLDFRQLVFIFSYGRFDSSYRIRLKTLVSRALNENKFIVLVVIGDEHESLFDAKKVEFVDGKVKMH